MSNGREESNRYQRVGDFPSQNPGNRAEGGQRAATLNTIPGMAATPREDELLAKLKEATEKLEDQQLKLAESQSEYAKLSEEYEIDKDEWQQRFGYHQETIKAGSEIQ